MRKLVHLTITGRVQGVGYRAFVEVQAELLELEGWVRNRRDGSVEAVAAGDADLVEALVEACRKGPPASRVIAVKAVAVTEDMLALRLTGETFSVLQTV